MELQRWGARNVLALGDPSDKKIFEFIERKVTKNEANLSETRFIFVNNGDKSKIEFCRTSDSSKFVLRFVGGNQFEFAKKTL
jgi:hypothetical protein